MTSRNRFARLEMPSALARRSCATIWPASARAANRPQPYRRRRHDPGDRLQHRRHDHDAAGSGRLRHPTILLVGGSGAVDRDETRRRHPHFRQLAGALAERGFMVLRYDKRGIGQTGGRTETVTQQDYADDLIGVVKWLAKRDDVDPRRLAVAGHGEGGRSRCSRRRARRKSPRSC